MVMPPSVQPLNLIPSKVFVPYHNSGTVSIRIKAGLKYTQGLKYTPGGAAE